MNAPTSFRTLFRAVPALLSFVIGSHASAQSSATTTPVGAIKVTLAAATVGGSQVTTFSPALRLPISGSFSGKSVGTITGIATGSVSDSTANWTAGALSHTAAPYFIKITSGAAAGSMWQVSTTSANTATTLNVLALSGMDVSTCGILIGDKYEIIPADTISTLFAGLESAIGGPNVDSADNVKIHDGSSWRIFYYNSSNAQWREGSSSFNRNTIIIRPNSGVIYTRRGQTPLTITIIGNVVSGSEKFIVQSSGATFIGGVHPVDRQLSTFDLQSMSGFVFNKGDLNAADKIKFYDGSSWRLLNYNGSQWREGSSSFNRNTLVVPAGTPIVVERGSGATGSAVLAAIPAPYTL